MHNVQSLSLAGNEWSTTDKAPSGSPPPEQGNRPESRFGRRPANAPAHPLRRPTERPSISRRIFRSVGRFAVAVLIGVGATLGWQSYGDAAREMLVARVPSLALWLPASKPSAVATAPDPMQQLGPMAFNLDALRRSVEQLSARQDQMTQNIAALQAVGDEIRQKVSAPPPAPAQPVAAPPQHRSPQARIPAAAAVPRSQPPAATAPQPR